MKREIIGFGVDEEDDPFAKLNCGHRQHVQHIPPLAHREWVLTENGRQSKMGQTLDYVRCDNLEFPDTVTPFQQTPVFTEETIPAGIQKDHRTGAGVWARVSVEAGQLNYRAEALNVDMILSPEQDGIIVPNVFHSVQPMGNVRFQVTFYSQEAVE